MVRVSRNKAVKFLRLTGSKGKCLRGPFRGKRPLSHSTNLFVTSSTGSDAAAAVEVH